MPYSADLAEAALEYLREFGVEDLPGRLVFRHGDVWLTTASEIPKGLRVHAVGVRLWRAQNGKLKPTSFGLQALGPLIKARRVEVSRSELKALLLGRAINKPGLPQGYVALCLEGEVLGCGEVRGETLRCQIPLGRRQELLVALAQEDRIAPVTMEKKGVNVKTQEDVLKGAILLEERGRVFYEHAALSAQSPGVREIFTILAQEEGRHKEYLAKILSELFRTGQIEASGLEPLDVSSAVLTESVKREIEAAGFEAAAIYAGMALEERAVAFYTEKAKTAPPALAKLYTGLAQWEQKHLDLLTALDEELRQRIWHERGFWPLD